jgi:hypothetical protein
MIYAPPLGGTVVLKGRGRGCTYTTAVGAPQRWVMGTEFPIFRQLEKTIVLLDYDTPIRL